MGYTTLWEVPDGLWEKIEQLLPPDKPAGGRGRPPLPNRQVFNGIVNLPLLGSPALYVKIMMVDLGLVDAASRNSLDHTFDA